MTAEGGKLGTRNSIKLSRHLIRMPRGSHGAFLGTSDWEETPGQTQNTLERLDIPTSKRGSPRRSWRTWLGKQDIWTAFSVNAA